MQMMLLKHQIVYLNFLSYEAFYFSKCSNCLCFFFTLSLYNILMLGGDNYCYCFFALQEPYHVLFLFPETSFQEFSDLVFLSGMVVTLLDSSKHLPKIHDPA